MSRVRKLSVSLPPDVAAAAIDLANATNRPLSQIVSDALRQFLSGTTTDVQFIAVASAALRAAHAQMDLARSQMANPTDSAGPAGTCTPCAR